MYSSEPKYTNFNSGNKNKVKNLFAGTVAVPDILSRIVQSVGRMLNPRNPRTKTAQVNPLIRSMRRIED